MKFDAEMPLDTSPVFEEIVVPPNSLVLVCKRLWANGEHWLYVLCMLIRVKLYSFVLVRTKKVFECDERQGYASIDERTKDFYRSWSSCTVCLWYAIGRFLLGGGGAPGSWNGRTTLSEGELNTY